MSEKLHHPSPEHHKHTPEHESHHQAERLKEIHEKGEKAEHEAKNNIESIQKSIENAAISGKEYSTTEKETPQNPSYGLNKELKSTAYRRVIKKTQSQLSTPEKTLSKVIHNPVVEKTSDIAAKTVARPTGILFGGIGAFIGTLVLLYISKRSGFTYNYLVFVLIFVSCYAAGSIVELLVGSARRASKK